MAIPKIIHQMWRDDSVSPRWSKLCATWKALHPSWEYRFWTDSLLFDFVSTHYRAFLPVYEAYARPIMKADAARYLLLHHFGGVYADIDSECIRCHDSLVADAHLILPLEPRRHLQVPSVVKADLSRLVGNAWIASEQGHPFWDLAIHEMVSRQNEPDPLVATGPIMLTQLINRVERRIRVKLLPCEVVYPASKFDRIWLSAREPGSRHWFSKETFAFHYWDGTWWGQREDLWKVRVMIDGSRVGSVVMQWANCAPSCFVEDQPLVSCVMFADDPDLLALAIRSFSHQSYPNRELLVISQSGLELPNALDLEPLAIRFRSVSSEEFMSPFLVDVALRETSGAFVCNWSSDYFSTPTRIECQIRVLNSVEADACAVSNVTLWWPRDQKLATSASGLWQCGILWRRSAIERRGDAITHCGHVPLAAVSGVKFALIDSPELCVQICDAAHYSPEDCQGFWRSAKIRSEGEECRLALRVMQHLVPCDEYEEQFRYVTSPSTAGICRK